MEVKIIILVSGVFLAPIKLDAKFELNDWWKNNSELNFLSFSTQSNEAVFEVHHENLQIFLVIEKLEFVEFSAFFKVSTKIWGALISI